MSVQYKVIERVNPRDTALPKKFYAKIINGDNTSFDELAEVISKVSNLNYGSVLGTLGTLMEVVEIQLIHGRQVRLSNLGTLFLTISSDGVDSEDQFQSANITGANIRFRPSARLKKLARNLKYEKVAPGSSAVVDK
jgi:predicted histone-like DNA-binding protein